MHTGLRLFGRTYSGLEYDYLGLCHVYETLHEFEKYLRYAHILENWQLLRGQHITQNVNTILIYDKYFMKLILSFYPTEEIQLSCNRPGFQHRRGQEEVFQHERKDAQQ